MENHLTDEITLFHYDGDGRLVDTAVAEDDAFEQYAAYAYDEYSSLAHTYPSMSVRA